MHANGHLYVYTWLPWQYPVRIRKKLRRVGKLIFRTETTVKYIKYYVLWLFSQVMFKNILMNSDILAVSSYLIINKGISFLIA